MAVFYRFLFILLLVGGSLRGYGQQTEPLLSGRFEHLRFEQFARQVEASSPYHLYFNPADVDSLTINFSVTAQPIGQVLKQALAGTKLLFSLDAAHHVFISTAPGIQTSLNTVFFDEADLSTYSPDEELATNDVAAGARPGSTSATKLYELGKGQPAPANGKATLAGRLRDRKSGEPVVGASVYVENPTIGASTDQFGSYSLTLPVGRYSLNIRGLGIKNTKRQIFLHADSKLDVDVDEEVARLKEVVIEAEKDKNVSSTQMGVEKLDIKTIKQVPTAFGEADIIRVVLMLPGVKSIGEGSTGMSVRGGNTDQNLILFNDAVIYNPSHLFGFFSAFNPDVLKSVELYKSAIPARYGGRLASVLDITTREGNRKKLSGAGGIGLLTSRLALEGPLVKDKGSFLLSGRTSYSDWLLHLVPDPSLKNSAASFYDLSTQLSYDLDEKNSLYASGYVSHDRFRLASDTVYEYRNIAASLKWKHNINNQLYGVFTGTFSQYQFSNSNQENPVNASRFGYELNQSGVQADFSYFRNSQHTITFGGSSLLYHVQPGGLAPVGSASLIAPDVLPREQALESALYVSDHFDVTPRFSVEAGLRYSLYNALGPRDINNYLPDVSKSESTITGTTSYGSGKILKTYQGPEYRLSARYSLTANASIKASLNRTRQYIHQLSNTAAMSPTDTWKLSDSYIRPQVGDQISLGYYHNFKNNTIETSVETYYKSTRDFVDYKSGAVLILNHHLETDVVNAQGKAYGVEATIRKSSGKVNGWLSYTYSRSLVRVNTATDQVNGGNYYPSNYDKPHDVTLVGNYRFSRRFSTSLNFNYSTGRPITLPLAKYYINNTLRVFYSDRNAYRVPDYYRLDFAFNIEGNHKVHKLFHSSWTLGVYNVTGRKNPYSVYFKSQNGNINGYQLSIFGEPIPTITYNFRF